MSEERIQQQKKSRNTDVSREVNTNKGHRLTRADVENYLSVTKGPLYIPADELEDPEYVHKWVDGLRPGRLDRLLDWGAVVVQRHDRDGKLKDDTRMDKGDHLIHIKVPRHLHEMIEELKRKKKLELQDQPLDPDEINEVGPAVTTVKTHF